MAVIRLIRLFRRERFELIYVHTSLAAFLCRIAFAASFLKGTRLIYVCHGYFFRVNKNGRVKAQPGSLFYLACEKLLKRQTSTLVLMNREDFDSARRYRLCRDIRFCHGMGLDTRKYAVPARTKASGGEVVFLCVGEFSARKNQAEIIRAFATMRDVPQAALWFAGEGIQKENCRRLAEKLDIGHKVRFWGHVRDISALYLRADVLVCASRSEGLPFCVMEALYFSLPVIASDIKGHRDLITNGINGTLYSRGDTKALAENMARLAASEEERTRFSKKAELGKEYFIEQAGKELFEILDMD